MNNGSRKGARIIPLLVLVAGILIFGVGLAMIGQYVFGAVILRLGKPDQSLLFWYLPFLLGGCGLSSLGGGIGFLALQRLRGPRS